MGKLTENQLKEFKQNIYEPYNRAWRIIQELKQEDLTKQETWDKYVKVCNEFKMEYPSEIGDSIFRVLLDAGTEASKIYRMQ